jgi:hypothetical protein
MIQPEIKHLYRYRKPTLRNFEMLSRNEIYFSAATAFNDPFDCSIELIIDDSKSGQEIIEHSVKRYEKYFGISEAVTREKLEPFGRANSQQLKEICESIRKIDMSGIKSGFGILSLSEIDNHPLMWAHYADGHKGFCIEYQRTPENDFQHCQPIRYSETYPKVDLFNTDFKEVCDLALFTKSKHWKYEREWRRVINEPSVTETYKNGFVTGIIFGAKMESQHKGAIARALEGKPKVNYYQARLKEHSYDLYIDAL